MQIWDRLMAAGREHGIRAGGYRVLESLRIEKGFRYFGTDLTATDTPDEGGVGFCVAAEKDFIGAARLPPRSRAIGCAPSSWRRRVPLPVRRRGRADRRRGRRPRAQRAFGFTLVTWSRSRRSRPSATEGTRVTVDVLGEPVEATVEPDVLYDPRNGRIRR